MTPRAADKNEAGDQGIGAARDTHETNPLVRSVERATDELRTARAYIERDLERNRQDVRDLSKQAQDNMLDVSGRLKLLESKVADLPTKVWIGSVVTTVVGLAVAVITLAYKLATGH